MKIVSLRGRPCPRCGRRYHFFWTARWHWWGCLLTTVLSDDVSRETSSPPLSLKCKIYDDRPHYPCAGTTDDGTGRRCSCACHTRWSAGA